MADHTKEILDGLREPTWKWGLPPEVQEVLEAARKLITKMEVVMSSKEYQAVWVLAHNHGMPYKGDNWKNEFDTLVSSLDVLKESEAKDE